ncbi:MAG: NAD(P)H-dependent oxidoreductase, partial [Planctomycetota bacterium]
YTFSVTEDGNYEGLVTGKPVFIAYSRGGAYPAGTEMEAFDFQTKYLELALGFMGLTDIRFAIAEPTLMNGPEAAGQAKADALRKAKEIAKTF